MANIYKCSVSFNPFDPHNKLLRQILLFSGFPAGDSGKEPACQCRRDKRCELCLWVGKISQKRKWQPIPVFFFFFIPVFLPRKSHGQRNLEGYNPWGHKESATTQQQPLFSSFTDKEFRPRVCLASRPRSQAINPRVLTPLLGHLLYFE